MMQKFTWSIISACLFFLYFFVAPTGYGEEKMPTVYEKDDIRSGLYSYRPIDDGIMITYYWGDEACIIIPDYIDGQLVRVIGQDCFFDNDTAWYVIVPRTVHTIENSAFENCSLRQIYIPDGLQIIGNAAFASTKLISVYLPESIEHIGQYVFWECKNLRSVHIASNLKILPVATFADCTNLTEVYLNDSIQQIDTDAFAYCFSLETIHFPANLQSVFYSVFCDSKNLDDDAKQYLEKIVIVANDEDDE